MRDTLKDLQALVETLKQNGDDVGQRIESILRKYQAAPPKLQFEVLASVEFLSEELPTLNAALRLANRFDRNGRG